MYTVYCLSPWRGSNPACIPKVWGHTLRAPCGLPETECHSQRTTRQRTAHWSARSEWTAGKRTGRCRWVLRRERTYLVRSSFRAASKQYCCSALHIKPSITYITIGMVHGTSCVLLEWAILWIAGIYSASVAFSSAGDDVISGFGGYW